MDVDYGAPVRMYIDYNFATQKFSLSYRDAGPFYFSIPDIDARPELQFNTVEVEGDIDLNFIGFGPMGERDR